MKAKLLNTITTNWKDLQALKKGLGNIVGDKEFEHLCSKQDIYQYAENCLNLYYETNNDFGNVGYLEACYKLLKTANENSYNDIYFYDGEIEDLCVFKKPRDLFDYILNYYEPSFTKCFVEDFVNENYEMGADALYGEIAKTFIYDDNKELPFYSCTDLQRKLTNCVENGWFQEAKNILNILQYNYEFDPLIWVRDETFEDYVVLDDTDLLVNAICEVYDID